MRKDIVILAAGIGKRLLPYTTDIPKCLVEVNNKAIIENILDSLLNYKEKVEAVHIVLGYKKEEIIERLKGKYKELNINYIENDIYRETNNIYSLWLSGKYIKKDLILFESDVYFDPLIIDDLFNTDKNIALVDKYESFMEGTALEVDNDGMITNIITKKRHSDLRGLYKTLNLYHFTADFFKEIFLPTLEIYMKTQSRNSYYEVILKLLVFLGKQKIYAKCTDGRAWYEIDDMEDLRNARYLFSSDEEKISFLKKAFGGYWNYKFHDFNLLYNDYFPDENFMEEYKSSLRELISSYPSNDRILLDKIRKILPFNVEAEHIIQGNGSCHLIKELFKLTGEEKTAVPVPTFGEYTKEEYNNVYFETEEDNFSVNIEKFIKFIEKEQAKQVVIVNPCNPTSLVLKKEDIEKLCKLPSLKYVIIDESFINFCDRPESIIDKYKNYEKLIIVKSLGKEYGIPGIRFGCIITCNEKILKTMRENLPIWNINSFVEFFLDRVGRYKDLYKMSLEKIKENRRTMEKEIGSICEINLIGPSQTNFILGRLKKGDINNLQKYLFVKYKILIKVIDKIGVSGKNYFRVSVRTEELNSALIKGLKEYLEQ